MAQFSSNLSAAFARRQPYAASQTTFHSIRLIMKNSFFPLVLLVSSLVPFAAASPVPGCAIDSTTAIPVRYIIGLGKREAHSRRDGGGDGGVEQWGDPGAGGVTTAFGKRDGGGDGGVEQWGDPGAGGVTTAFGKREARFRRDNGGASNGNPGNGNPGNGGVSNGDPNTGGNANGKCEARSHNNSSHDDNDSEGGNALSSDSGDVNGGHVISDSGGGDQENEGSSRSRVFVKASHSFLRSCSHRQGWHGW